MAFPNLGVNLIRKEKYIERIKMGVLKAWNSAENFWIEKGLNVTESGISSKMYGSHKISS